MVFSYALGGAKTAPLTALVFMVLLIFFQLQKPDTDLSLDRDLFYPFFLLFAAGLFGFASWPPLDLHLFGFFKLIAFTCFGFMAFRSNEETHQKLIKSVVALALIESLVVLVMIPWKGLNARSAGYLAGNPSYAGLLQAAALLHSFHRLGIKNSPRSSRLVHAAGVLFFAGMLAFMRTRSVQLGLLAAVFLFTWKFWRYYLVASLVGALVVFLAVPNTFWEFIFQDWSGRWIIWKTALIALRHKWWAGWGLGNFETAYVFAQQADPRALLPYGKTTAFAHNNFLQMSVELGLPGFLAVAYLTTVLIRRIKISPSTPWVKKWAISILILYGITGLSMFTMFLPINGLLFAASLGMALSGTATTGKQISQDAIKTGLKSLMGAGAFFMALYGAGSFFLMKGNPVISTTLVPFSGSFWYEKVQLEQNHEPLDNVIKDLDTSLSWDRQNAFAWMRKARTLMALADGPAAEIEKCLSNAGRLAPRHAPFKVDAAFYFLKKGDERKAHDLFDTARLLEPRTPLPLYGLGLCALRRNEIGKAARLFEACLKINDRYRGRAAASPYSDFLFGINKTEIETLLNHVSKSSG